jgi:hypothetical protein
LQDIEDLITFVQSYKELKTKNQKLGNENTKLARCESRIRKSEGSGREGGRESEGRSGTNNTK